MRYVCALLIALCPATALAQSACRGETQLDANICAKEQWSAADQELNRLWKTAKSKADDRGTGAALLREQKAWLRERDTECDPEMKQGGSADAMFYWNCMQEQTLHRNSELRAMR